MHVPYHIYSFLAPNLKPMYQAVTDALTRALGIPFELHTGEHYAQVAQADFSWICGLPYVLRESDLVPLAAPVLAGERYQNRPIYFSDVIVRADSRFHTFTDLRGCSWAYNEPESQSGYGITRYHLVQMGETSGFFGSVVQAGFHQHAIHLVATGQIDAAAIDSHTLAIELEHHPHMASKLRTIAVLGPSTIQPFTASAAVPQSLQDEVQHALASITQDEQVSASFTRFGVQRLTPVSAADYDDIRAMLAACQKADFLTLR